MPKTSRRIKYYLLFLKSLMKINWSLLVGMWKLTRLPQPAITVFGGSKLPRESVHSERICALTRKLAARGFSIITGGGPGIMEAANLGASKAGTDASNNKKNKAHKLPNGLTRDDQRRLVSLGISVAGLQEKNDYTQEFITLPYFFIRKWLLVRYSVGFIIAPGGFGTLDELVEVLTLIQTKQMPLAPIVMIGREYWAPFIDWINTRALRDGLLEPQDASLITLTDDIHEAFAYLVRFCNEDSACALDFNHNRKK